MTSQGFSEVKKSGVMTMFVDGVVQMRDLRSVIVA